jgi:hypothetical protein
VQNLKKFAPTAMAILLAGATLLTVQGTQSFTGVITDDECSRAEVSPIRAGAQHVCSFTCGA